MLFSKLLHDVVVVGCSMAGVFPIISVKMKCERKRTEKKLLYHINESEQASFVCLEGVKG